MATKSATREESDDPDGDLSNGGPVPDERGAARDDGETASAALRGRSDPSATHEGRLWQVVAGLGAVSLLGAMAVVVLPGTVLAPLQFTAETVQSLRSFALLLGAFVGIFGLYVAYHRETDDDAEDFSHGTELPRFDLERARGPTNQTVGEKLDDDLDRIGGMSEGDSSVQYTAYQIEQNVEALAVEVVANEASCSVARAQQHVAQGTWTDDVRAAAFVGGPDAPNRPLSMRIRDWAAGATFDRQVRATVDELAELDGGDER